jgi:Bacterial conjugation TrbI-like protein
MLAHPLDEGPGVTTMRVVRIFGAIIVLLAIGAGGSWYVLTKTKAGQQLQQQAYGLVSGDMPGWTLQPIKYTAPKPEPDHAVPAAAPAPPPPPPKPSPVATPKPTPQPRKRVPLVTLINEHRDRQAHEPGDYTLSAWTYISCTLENVLVSEIEGMFTVRTTRPVWDATGSVILIPQHQRIGAKAVTADLLFGNERMPTFALSTTLQGKDVDLGQAPIMDAAGTNGLTGEVDHHVWRVVWTSFAKGGLQGGQQVLQTQLGPAGAGPIAAGIAREGSSQAQQRLGRAQDTRPTITVASGELCQILIPKALQLPAYQGVPAVSRRTDALP